MDLKQMGIDPREALAVGALAHDLLKPRRVDDLETFLAKYPHITQYIEQYLGFGYASIPSEVISGLSVATPTREPQVPEGLLTPFTEVADAEGDNQPQPGLDAELL